MSSCVEFEEAGGCEVSDLPLHMGHRLLLPNTAHSMKYMTPPTAVKNVSMTNHTQENFFTGSTCLWQKVQYFDMIETTIKNYKKSVVAW